MESINGVSCNLSGLVRRCFYTGFVPEEKPGRGWRQVIEMLTKNFV